MRLKVTSARNKIFIWVSAIFILLILLISIIMVVRVSGDFEVPEKEGTRFVTYNMMFGMYGREGVFNALGHFSFHGIKSSLLTRMFSRLNDKTVTFIGNSDADFISLNEVLGTLKKDEIVEGLRGFGFKNFCWGPATHHDKPLDLGTLLASKYSFKKLNFTFPQEPHMGGGGGACAVFVEEKNLTILALHMGLGKELQSKQIKKISEFVIDQGSKKRRVVVMGDFNLDEEALGEFHEFAKLNLSVANSKGTAPNIEEIKPFEFEAWDNVFYKGFKLNNSGVLSGLSDHKLVWADFEL
jgi:endonuclease/exonuclease/phosphatase family metal-dependent hydrolase